MENFLLQELEHLFTPAFCNINIRQLFTCVHFNKEIQKKTLNCTQGREVSGQMLTSYFVEWAIRRCSDTATMNVVTMHTE